MIHNLSWPRKAKKLPAKLNGWSIKTDEFGLIHATKKKEKLVFPNSTRMYHELNGGSK